MEPILGSIMVFAGNFPPKNWAFCDGSLIPIRSNTPLFAILGTTYGGDGKTTFALPDLRGRVPVSTGQGPGLTDRTLGEPYGTETVTMLLDNMPIHTHATIGTVGIGANSGTSPDSDTPVNNYLCGKSVNSYANNPGGAMGNSPVTPGQITSSTGQSTPYGIIQPSLGLNYCIALYGIFPQRP